MRLLPSTKGVISGKPERICRSEFGKVSLFILPLVDWTLQRGSSMP